MSWLTLSGWWTLCPMTLFPSISYVRSAKSCCRSVLSELATGPQLFHVSSRGSQGTRNCEHHGVEVLLLQVVEVPHPKHSPSDVQHPGWNILSNTAVHVRTYYLNFNYIKVSSEQQTGSWCLSSQTASVKELPLWRFRPRCISWPLWASTLGYGFFTLPCFKSTGGIAW